jgi:hypothetical protein
MRKYVRELMRVEAKRNKLPYNRAVKYFWNQLQLKTKGLSARDFNQARGTHKKKMWPSRFIATYDNSGLRESK